MKKDISEIINNSKRKLQKTFFRIVSLNNNYVIKEYYGPIKSVTTMMKEGWNRHAYLTNYINEAYPHFNIADFKSTDGIKIEKISDTDKLKNELNEFIEYYKMSPKLYENVRKLKVFLTQFNISNIGKYFSFNDLKNDLLAILNNYSSNAIDKQKYNLVFSDIINSIYMELETLNIENSHVFFDKKFKYFISLIK